MMAEIVELPEAVAALVSDGDSIALEGFTHLIPFAAGHELLRQGRTELELIRMTPDILYDQMIGVGAARKLVFSCAGNPGVGALHRIRDVLEHGWPRQPQSGDFRFVFSPTLSSSRLIAIPGG
jgi:glutaconate CoA-transferase, subunit A